MTVLYLICAASGWGGLGYLIWSSRQRWTPTRVALLAAFGFLAATMTLWAVSLIVDINTALGLNEVARLGAHLCVMGIVATASYGLHHLAYSPEVARIRSRRRIVGASAGALLLIAIYTLTLRLHPPVQLNVESARHLEVTGYLTVFLTACAWCAVDVTRLLWRLADVTRHPWMLRGLHTAAVGTGCGVVYVISKVGYVVGYWLRLDPHGEHQSTAILLTLGSVLFAVGMTMPKWGPGIDATRRWGVRLRYYQQLWPLWRDLTATMPNLVLAGGRQHRRWLTRGLGFALQRRMAEIADGRRALRTHVDPQVTIDARHHGQAAGLTGQALDAYVVAIRIRVALDALAAGHEPTGNADPLYDPDGDYDIQLAWLAQVADTYRRLPRTASADGVLAPAR